MLNNKNFERPEEREGYYNGADEVAYWALRQTDHRLEALQKEYDHYKAQASKKHDELLKASIEMNEFWCEKCKRINNEWAAFSIIVTIMLTVAIAILTFLRR